MSPVVRRADVQRSQDWFRGLAPAARLKSFQDDLLVCYPGQLKVKLWEYIGVIVPQTVKGYLLYYFWLRAAALSTLSISKESPCNASAESLLHHAVTGDAITLGT